MRAIVTRPQQDARKWVDALSTAGLDAVSLPLIEVSGAPDSLAVVTAWERLNTFDAVMFVSGNAVAQFFKLKPAVALVDTAQAAIKIRALVTGPGSFSALLRAGVDSSYIDCPDLEAGHFDSEALWAVVGHKVQPGYRVLIVRGGGSATQDGDAGHGRDWFAKQVREAGGAVEFVVSYQRSCPDFSEEEHRMVQQAAHDGSVWIFSSSEAVANLVSQCPHQSWRHARAVATHQRIAQAAREAGFAVVCESRPSLQDVMASIESLQ